MTTESSSSSLTKKKKSLFSSHKTTEEDELKTTTTTTTIRPNDRISTAASTLPLQHQKQSSSSWITTKAILLQSLGCIYWVAFLAAYYQNEGLFGDDGLIPARNNWEQQQLLQQQNYATAAAASSWWWRWQGFCSQPSLFWFIKLNDDTMRRVNLSGLTLSTLLVVVPLQRRRRRRQQQQLGDGGVGESKLMLLTLWLLYFSIVTTASSSGTPFYSYGWESQLLETGFLAIFLCDSWIIPYNNNTRMLLSPHSAAAAASSSSPSPSPIILWLFRWLCFRISMGAGLIKIRGDSCWTNKTCLWYHFETQPIPSPTSFFFHFLPKYSILQRAVDLDLFVQVYTSWMVLLPTSIPGCPQLSRVCLYVVRIGGMIQVAFMLNIIVSGNLGFLPHLTIVPALACFDDPCFCGCFGCWPRWMRMRGIAASTHNTTDGTNGTIGCVAENGTTVPNKNTFIIRMRQWIIQQRPNSILNAFVAVLILYLSRPVVSNLLQLDGSGQRQLMNASFGSFRLVNTYGAFGSVGKERYEPIVSIAYSSSNDDDDPLEWIEVEFPCKPGSIDRRPCFCEPYHYRLDWNIWFIGFKPHQAYLNRRETWLYKLLEKMLLSPDATMHRPWLDLLDQTTAEMLRSNYKNGRAPIYAKVDMYRYQMSGPLWKLLPQYLSNGGGGMGRRIQWWNRTFAENLIPVVQLGDDQRLARATLGG